MWLKHIGIRFLFFFGIGVVEVVLTILIVPGLYYRFTYCEMYNAIKHGVYFVCIVGRCGQH